VANAAVAAAEVVAKAPLWHVRGHGRVLVVVGGEPVLVEENWDACARKTAGSAT
jgi:hypothetical protein